jgi:hypothetical protein
MIAQYLISKKVLEKKVASEFALLSSQFAEAHMDMPLL